MEKNLLAVIIPTYNRPENITFCLNAQMSALSARGVDLIIFDSSENNETQLAVKTYKYMHPAQAEHLFYERYCGNEMDLRALDRKVYTACKQYTDTYTYLWFCGDGPIFHIDELWDEIVSALKCGVDCVVFRSTLAKTPNVRFYESSKLFLQDYCWVLTLLGSTIFSSKRLEVMVQRCPVITGNDFWYWLPMAFFHIWDREPISAVVLDNERPYDMNPYRKEAYWKTNGDVFWQWAKIWPDAVNQLPSSYNGIKEKICRAPEKNMKLFSIKGLLGLKADGQLDVKNIYAYRKYFKQVTSTPVAAFYLIAILGNKKILVFLRRVYRSIKGEKNL